MFTELFNEGVLPPVWLTSIVTPVFKKGLVSDPPNYRPIAHVYCLSRHGENKDTVMSYLYDHKLINKAQHGELRIFRGTDLWSGVTGNATTY